MQHLSTFNEPRVEWSRRSWSLLLAGLVAYLLLLGGSETPAPPGTPQSAAGAPRGRSRYEHVRRLRTAQVAAVMVASSLFAPHTHRRPIPGSNNGRLAFGMNVDGNTDIYSVLPTATPCVGSPTIPASMPARATRPTARTSPSAAPRPGGFEIWTMKHNGTEEIQLTQLGSGASFPTTRRTVAPSPSTPARRAR